MEYIGTVLQRKLRKTKLVDEAGCTCKNQSKNSAVNASLEGGIVMGLLFFLGKNLHGGGGVWSGELSE